MRLNHISRHIFLDKNFCYLKKYNIYIIYMPTKRRYRKTRSKGTNRRYRKTRSKGKLTYKMRGWHRGGNHHRRSRNSGRGLGRSSHSLQLPLSSKHNPSVPPSNATTRKAKEPTLEKYIRVRSEEEEEEKERKKQQEARKKLEAEAKRQRPGARHDLPFPVYPDVKHDPQSHAAVTAAAARRALWQVKYGPKPQGRLLRLLKRAAAEAAGTAGGGYKRKRTRRRTRKMFKEKRDTKL
jgi:hypothetical protein